MARKIKPPKDETAEGRIVQRPDGFYWEPKGGELRGPFSTRDEAEADRLAKVFGKEKIEVIGEGYLNNLELRFPNEPARHKLLDGGQFITEITSGVDNDTIPGFVMHHIRILLDRAENK